MRGMPSIFINIYYGAKTSMNWSLPIPSNCTEKPAISLLMVGLTVQVNQVKTEASNSLKAPYVIQAVNSTYISVDLIII